MDNTIKFNFLKFSEGSLEGEKNKKNLLVNNERKNNEEDDSKFILNSENLKKISIGEGSNHPVIDLPIKKMKNIKANKNKMQNNNENELAIAENNITIEKTDSSKLTNIKNINDQGIAIKENLLLKNQNEIKLNKVSASEKNLNNQDIEKNILNKDDKIFNDNQIINNTRQINSFKKVFSNFTENNKTRVKSFFKNYINYSNKKKFKENLQLEKLVLSNNLIAGVKNNKTTLNFDNISMLNGNDISHKEDLYRGDQLSKENNETLDANVIKEKNQKLTNSPFKNIELNSFDRLKNILDIRSNDVNERLAQIFENNINNKKNKFEIQLRPENLGKIQVSLEIIGENVDININSDNMNTSQILLENNNNLQKMLQSQGMNLNSFNLNNNNKNKEKEKENNSLSTKDENKEVSKNDDTNQELDAKLRADKLVYIKA